MMILERDGPLPSSRVRWHFNKAREVRRIKIMYPGENQVRSRLLAFCSVWDVV